MTDANAAIDRPRQRVRSFVRREGRMTTAQKAALETHWDVYGINCTPGMLLDFPALFGRNAPVVLEIGFGMGDTLLHMSAAHPEWNFLGVEVHRPGVGRLLSQLHVQQVSNVRVLCADAVEIVNSHVAAASLDRILIFFPDPWPKKRQQKRRLIQTELIALLATKLRPRGILHLATDWQDYAEQMLATVSGQPMLRNVATAGDYVPRPDYRPITKFEQRGQRLGHGIWDLIFERV